ncbi:hypothetical protein ACS0TY_018971 [Phlomoides rotata]
MRDGMVIIVKVFNLQTEATFRSLGVECNVLQYVLEGVVSTRFDVYSYGVMLIETYTRKRPSDDMFGGDLSLKSWVESLLPQQVMGPTFHTSSYLVALSLIG